MTMSEKERSDESNSWRTTIYEIDVLRKVGNRNPDGSYGWCWEIVADGDDLEIIAQRLNRFQHNNPTYKYRLIKNLIETGDAIATPIELEWKKQLVKDCASQGI